VHPLYTILVPEKVDPFVRSFLLQYRCVGYLPTIPYFGRETFCMIGVHSIPVITDAWLKGFRGFDGEEALEAVTNALTVTHRSRPRAEWARMTWPRCLKPARKDGRTISTERRC
jgi:putative alpha-1,2-mannosidase